MTLREASPLTHENVAMIAGATGQDGAYLAELSLNNSQVVHSVKRRSSSVNAARVYHLYYDLHEQSCRSLYNVATLSMLSI